MKKNSSAYTLIRSLTMSEKRYFKIFSERHIIGSQNKYVALFDQMDKTEQEIDSELIKGLTRHGISSKFISADKNYLYNLVLRSLNDFHASRTYNLGIKESLISIEILFYKGLYTECLKLISKTEVLAEECESFQLMIDLLNWKKKCCGYSLGLQKAAEINRLIDTYLILLNNLKRITDLYYESYFLYTGKELLTPGEISKRFKKIMTSPELRNEKSALSFSAKIMYHLCYANYYSSDDNKQDELDSLQKLVDMLNGSKLYAIENPLDYVSIYNRLLAMKKYFSSSSFFEDLLVLRKFPDKVKIRKEVVLQRVFIYSNTQELEFCLINNDFKMALSKTREIEREFKELSVEIEPYHMIYFYYLHVVTLIFVGKFHDALKLINKTFEKFSNDARPSVYLRVEVLNAIVHYELKNCSLVIKLIKQVLKKDTDRKILIPFEEKLLRAVLKIAGIEYITMKEESAILRTLEIEKTEATAKVHGSNLIDNYEKWLKAKLKRKTVEEFFG
jgi:hypothetical protein